LLRRIEITAACLCVSFALIALLVARGRPGAALSVAAGGLLAGVSYYTIKSTTGSILGANAGGDERRSRASIAVRIAFRYALLAFLAYVMIARLRLHPLGLLAGASSVVAAVSVEALRLLLKKS
jgi:hypothetical protein